MRTLTVAAAAAIGAIAMSQIFTGNAAEIRVISANGMREVLAETKAKFEADTRHQLTITVVETGEIRKRVLAGENFDVIMVPQRAADELEKAGKIVRRQRGAIDPRQLRPRGAATMGRSPTSARRKRLKSTFLRAKTVLITDPTTGGISGVHLMDVLDKLGIADEMKSRLVPQPGGGFHAARVVKGEADLAVQAEHEIRCVKGAMFLPYPAVFQRTIVFMGGVGSAAGDVAAAKAYLHYLTGADTDNTYSAHCLTRG